MAESGLPESFQAALRDLARWLVAESVPYTTIGGVAVSLLGQPRATQDIDVVVWLDQSRWESFVDAGRGFGFEERITDALDFAARSRVILLRHGKSGISVDVSCGALPFEREMIDRATTLRVGGIEIKVPTPEDLIITKAVAQRAKDIADIEALLRIQENLDVARIRRWTGEFAAALETPEMAELVERLLKQ